MTCLSQVIIAAEEAVDITLNIRNYQSEASTHYLLKCYRLRIGWMTFMDPNIIHEPGLLRFVLHSSRRVSDICH